MLDYQHLLKDKIALISTGARGIGKAIATLFAQQGATVLVGGRNPKYLEDTMRELCAIAPASKGYVADLTCAEDTERFACEALRDFGRVDVLVNVVGINFHTPVHLYSDENMEKFLESNYKSGMRLARALLPGMVERGDGSIVNISSIHAVQTMPGYALYAGTKGAMNASARAMALDYAGTGVRVNTICPGLIMSDAIKDEINGYPEGKERDDFIALLTAMQPLPIGQMEDVANAALYLASPISDPTPLFSVISLGGILLYERTQTGGHRRRQRLYPRDH